MKTTVVSPGKTAGVLKSRACMRPADSGCVHRGGGATEHDDLFLTMQSRSVPRSVDLRWKYCTPGTGAEPAIAS